MARKTKAEALATRSAILDAAERLFVVQGVSRTSLEHIACAAGVTRGAVYWHFKDKGAVFDAMMERVRLPLEESARQLGVDNGTPPLDRLRDHLMLVLERFAGDEQLRRVFEIATQKVEYVDELAAVRERHRQAMNELLGHMRHCLAADDPGRSAADVSAHARGLHAVVAGLMHAWMLDPGAFDMVAVGRQAVHTCLAGLAGTAGRRKA